VCDFLFGLLKDFFGDALTEGIIMLIIFLEIVLKLIVVDLVYLRILGVFLWIRMAEKVDLGWLWLPI
jgi:hypothetical protein